MDASDTFVCRSAPIRPCQPRRQRQSCPHPAASSHPDCRLSRHTCQSAPKSRPGSASKSSPHLRLKLSIGAEKGPPIGMQKGPLLIIGSGSDAPSARLAARSAGGACGPPGVNRGRGVLLAPERLPAEERRAAHQAAGELTDSPRFLAVRVNRPEHRVWGSDGMDRKQASQGAG